MRYMVRTRARLALGVLCLLILGITAWAAFAASVHFKPPHKDPTFTDNGLTLTGDGALAGLGNVDLVVTCIANGTPTSECINPGSGEHRPPGQQPPDVTVIGEQRISADEIKNGNVSFHVTTAEPVNPIPGAPGCPNPNWTQPITDVEFNSVTIIVEQPEGTVVLQKTFIL